MVKLSVLCSIWTGESSGENHCYASMYRMQKKKLYDDQK